MQPQHCIPYNMRKKIDEELEYLEKQDIIKKVKGPTLLVSAIVATLKPKNLHQHARSKQSCG